MHEKNPFKPAITHHSAQFLLATILATILATPVVSALFPNCPREYLYTHQQLPWHDVIISHQQLPWHDVIVSHQQLPWHDVIISKYTSSQLLNSLPQPCNMESQYTFRGNVVSLCLASWWQLAFGILYDSAVSWSHGQQGQEAISRVLCVDWPKWCH